MGELEDLRRRLVSGDPSAKEELRRKLEDPRARAGEHARWAELCELAGEPARALREYHLALRESPQDPSVLSRLCVLHEERGDLERAVEYAERWVGATPDDAEAISKLVQLLVAVDAADRAREALRRSKERGIWTPALQRLADEIDARGSSADGVLEIGGEESPECEEVPSDADAVRFAHMFAGRENVYARQWWSPRGEGGYTPVREPFTPQVARNHLLGNVTVGVYPIRLDETVCFCAFDIDITKRALSRARRNIAEARRLREAVRDVTRELYEALAGLGLEGLIEDSGYKGRHIWLFFDAPQPAEMVRQFGVLALNLLRRTPKEVHVEFFPKQARAGSGLGNLIKLPLGVHQRTGRRSRLLTADGDVIRRPFEVLRRHPRITRQQLLRAMEELKKRWPGAEPAAEAAEAAEPDAEAGSEFAAEDLPGPPPPRATWTDADFETHPEVSVLFARCHVLAALREKVRKHRTLSHDEQIVLMHSVGHTPAGVLAVNYLLDLCGNVHPSTRLKSPLAGNPISCPKIRKRIPHVTGTVPCNCLFDYAPERYPNPRLHLEAPDVSREATSPPERVEPRWDPVDRLRALGVLWRERSRIAAEIERLERELVDYMEANGVAEIATEEGVLRLVQEEGAPAALRWEAASPETKPAEQPRRGQAEEGSA